MEAITNVSEEHSDSIFYPENGGDMFPETLAKPVPLHAMEAREGRGGMAPADY
jgi:hypothetical protein